MAISFKKTLVSPCQNAHIVTSSVMSETKGKWAILAWKIQDAEFFLLSWHFHCCCSPHPTAHQAIYCSIFTIGNPAVHPYWTAMSLNLQIWQTLSLTWHPFWKLSHTLSVFPEKKRANMYGGSQKSKKQWHLSHRKSAACASEYHIDSMLPCTECRKAECTFFLLRLWCPELFCSGPDELY